MQCTQHSTLWKQAAAHTLSNVNYHANLSDLRTCQHESLPADMLPQVYLAELRVADFLPTAATGFSVRQNQVTFWLPSSRCLDLAEGTVQRCSE